MLFYLVHIFSGIFSRPDNSGEVALFTWLGEFSGDVGDNLAVPRIDGQLKSMGWGLSVPKHYRHAITTTYTSGGRMVGAASVLCLHCSC